MGTDIGYLQNKIRELQEKFDEIDKRLNESFKKEKLVKDYMDKYFTDIKTKQLEQTKINIHEVIETIYQEKFRLIFSKYQEDLNKQTILGRKAFNHSIRALMMEVFLLKKDSSFMMSLIKTKLNISDSDFTKFENYFDKKYPHKQVEKDLERFKMKNFKDMEKVKEIIGKDNQEEDFAQA